MPPSNTEKELRARAEMAEKLAHEESAKSAALHQRRKNNIERLERIIEKAESQADSVSKLNSVSFMVGGLMKAQESMDKFSGAQEAAPAVQINIGYDPLDQFRNVIQKEATTIIEIEPVESSDEEE